MDKSQLILRGQHYPETIIKDHSKKNKAKKTKTEERERGRNYRPIALITLVGVILSKHS